MATEENLRSYGSIGVFLFLVFALVYSRYELQNERANPLLEQRIREGARLFGLVIEKVEGLLVAYRELHIQLAQANRGVRLAKARLNKFFEEAARDSRMDPDSMEEFKEFAKDKIEFLFDTGDTLYKDPMRMPNSELESSGDHDVKKDDERKEGNEEIPTE